MAKKSKRSISDKTFRAMWEEARKDPNFHKEMKAFIKATTTPYKL